MTRLRDLRGNQILHYLTSSAMTSVRCCISHYLALKVKPTWPPLVWNWVLQLENAGFNHFYAISWIFRPIQGYVYTCSHISNSLCEPLGLGIRCLSQFLVVSWTGSLLAGEGLEIGCNSSPGRRIVLPICEMFSGHPFTKLRWSCGSRLRQLWPGGLESRSYEWAIIGVFSVIRPFRDEIRLKLSFVSAVKLCWTTRISYRHNKHDITAFHSNLAWNNHRNW